MKRTLKIILRIIAIFVGLGFVMPALAQWRHEGSMATSSIALLALGAVMMLASGSAAIRGFARRDCAR